MAFSTVFNRFLVAFSFLASLTNAQCNQGCASASHVPDSWCEAVQCAQTYIDHGICKCEGGVSTSTQTFASTTTSTTFMPLTSVSIQETTTTTALDPATTTQALLVGNGLKVIFRLDDVQDFFLSAQSQQIIGAFVEKGQQLSIGVIGGQFFGQDNTLADQVRAAVSNHGCEVFNHGDDASTLFDGISKEDAKVHIKNAEETGFTYTTFVPHQNRWSRPLLEALRELGYTTVSAAANGPQAMPVDLTSSPKQMPQAAQTAVFQGGAWIRDVDNVVSDCRSHLASAPTTACVVMMHPQEFQSGAVTIDDLKSLLDRVLQQGWEITTFQDFATLSTISPTAPPAFSTTSSATALTVSATHTQQAFTTSPVVQSSTQPLAPTTTPHGSCTGCCSIAPWETPTMDAWCQTTCAVGHCPETHCSDECRARRLSSDVWV